MPNQTLERSPTFASGQPKRKRPYHKKKTIPKVINPLNKTADVTTQLEVFHIRQVFLQNIYIAPKSIVFGSSARWRKNSAYGPSSNEEHWNREWKEHKSSLLELPVIEKKPYKKENGIYGISEKLLDELTEKILAKVYPPESQVDEATVFSSTSDATLD